MKSITIMFGLHFQPIIEGQQNRDYKRERSRGKRLNISAQTIFCISDQRSVTHFCSVIKGDLAQQFIWLQINHRIESYGCAVAYFGSSFCVYNHHGRIFSDCSSRCFISLSSYCACSHFFFMGAVIRCPKLAVFMMFYNIPTLFFFSSDLSWSWSRAQTFVTYLQF